MAVLGTHGRRRAAVPGLGELVGADVELRLGNGAVIRGELVALDADYMVIVRSTTRRRTYVRRDAVAAVIDETPHLSPRELTDLAGSEERPRRRGSPASEGGEL